MKTAISLPDNLFKEVVKLASENKKSRSQIFCLAVKEYLERVRSQKLLEALNETYSGEDTNEEKLLRKKSLEYYNDAILKDTDEDNAG